MRKSFPLEVPNRKPPRVIEAIKNDVRKYLKRERGKPLPEGADFWGFDCRFGRDEANAEGIHEAEINQRIDLAAGGNWPAVYVEIFAKPEQRKRKPRQEEDGAAPAESENSTELDS
jgi:hypothetical protein